MSDGPVSLACTSCAAPLRLLGGHRVKSLVCGYCGAVMDVHDEFKLLARYQNLGRPATPFRIGMTGTLKGVEFTIIGMVQYGYQDRWGSYEWVSSQLFSPTHGYAWITVEDGHCIFSRRIRDLPEPALPAAMEPKKSMVRLRGQTFRFYERFTARILFVEGELTWIAALGDPVESAEYIAPPSSFEFERSEGEIEYGLSEYLEPALVKQAFGIDDLPRRTGIHPAQPFIPGRFVQALATAGCYFLIIAACGLIFTAILGSGQQVADTSLQLTPGSSHQVDFQFSEPDHLLFVEVDTDINNNWTYIEAAILDAEDEEVAVLGREIGYYWGESGGDHWSEGSRATKATVKLPAAGSYRLAIEVDQESPVTVRANVGIWQGYMPGRYFTILTVAFLLAALSLPLRRWLFERQRWADVVDDDD